MLVSLHSETRFAANVTKKSDSAFLPLILISSEKPQHLPIDTNNRQHMTQAVSDAKQGFMEFRRMVAEEGLEPPTRGL